jgi:hypothetical protein
MTKNNDFKNSAKVKLFEREWVDGILPVRWSDDYSSVAALLNWSVGVDLEKMNADLKDTMTSEPVADGVGANSNVEAGDSDDSQD